jgi:CIC family chloride channel protein
LFVRLLGRLRGRVSALPRARRLPLPFAAGILVGLVGLVFPEVLGAGYGSIDRALHDEFGWRLLLTLGVTKMLTTAACFASGTPGGMFAPTLFIGAMIGGGIGSLAHAYWPVATSLPSAYVLVGMGTFFAAVFRAPMTSVFMVFEVSASYEIILPVMVANLIAYLVARKLSAVTFFEMVATQEGLQLPSHERQRDTQVRRVEDAMRSADELAPDAEVSITAPIVHPDQSLETALRLFGRRRTLTVVSRQDLSLVIGTLSLEDVLNAYGIERDTAPTQPPEKTR